MRFSSEVRWIMPGSMPGHVLEWFHRGGEVRKEPQRTDYYLDLGGSATASLKLRDGKAEFKVMCLPAPMPLELGDIEGLQNQWVKWSCPMSAEQSLDADCAQSGRLAVLKSRWLRPLGLDDNGDATDTGGSAAAGGGDGCEMELSNIRVLALEGFDAPLAEALWQETPQWWSLAIEARGERQKVVENLRRAAVMELTPPPPVQLDQEWSDAYPAWLAGRDIETSSH